MEDLLSPNRQGAGGTCSTASTTPTATIPCQIDGGLKCFGHPIGASGLRMAYEIYLQLLGSAGPAPAREPALGLTHNLGGVPRENISSVAIVGRYE